jgi:hypothetical protein
MSTGPVDLIVINFPGNQFRGEIIPAIQELVDAGTIRVIDILFAVREGDGDVRVFELHELESELLHRFDPVVAELTGLLTPDDARHLSAGIEPDSTIAMLLFENTWARKVADAMAAANGRLVFHERIPRGVVEDLVTEREQLIASGVTA